MHRLCKLNKHNMDRFEVLNDLRINFNKLNKDFFQVYDNLNIFKKSMLKKRLRLLKDDNRYIGYIWYECKTNSMCLINSMYVNEDECIIKNYSNLLGSLKPYSIAIYNCEKNHYNYNILLKLGFKMIDGLLEMNKIIDDYFKIESLEYISFHKVRRGQDEGIRCNVQNSVFCSANRIPLRIEDIYYDEMQDYYCEDAAILMKVRDKYVGYCQTIIKNNCPYIVNFGIVEKYRRNGYGKMLLKYMLNILHKKGIKLVKLMVNSNNIQAIKLYYDVGFVKEREQSQWQCNILNF